MGTRARVHASAVIENSDVGRWNWRLGERSRDPRLLQGGFGPPIAWQGHYITISGGSEDGRLTVSLWRLGGK